MTTNRPEHLDEALIRPGRVDHQVAFDNATQHQIKELFERMYTNDLPRTKLIINSPATNITSSSSTTKENGSTKGSAKGEFTPPLTPVKATSTTYNGYAKINSSLNEKIEEVQGAELASISREFASKVPDDMFSPAEIQGFLLKRKKDPRKALQEVETWVQGMLEMRGKGTKLVKVQ